MSYTTENAKDSAERNILGVLKPRVRRTSWTLHSGSVYKNPFSFGYITSVAINGVALTAGSSASLSAGQYYFDYANSYLYIRKSDSTAPAATEWVVVIFELFIATKEVYWYRDPVDNSTEVVFYRGILDDPPSVTRTVADQIFGFIPTQSTRFSCINDPELFQEFIYESSFYKCDLSFYHVVGTLKTANIEKILTASGGDVDWNDDKISFQAHDKGYLFDKRLDNSDGFDYFPFSTTSSTPHANNCDPNFSGRPIPTIYGFKKGLRGVAVLDFTAGPVDAANSWWCFGSCAWGSYNYDVPQLANGDTTTTVSPYHARMFKEALKFSSEFGVDATYDRINLGTDGNLLEFPDIVSIDTSTGVITHTARGLGATPPPFNKFRMVNWERLSTFLLQGGKSFTPHDGNVSGYATTESGAGQRYFYTSRPSAISFPGTDPAAIDGSADIFTANVLGIHIAPTIASATFGSPYNPVTILYHILKDRLGLAETEIDTDSFLTAVNETEWCAGLSTNESEDSEHPTYRDIISRLLATALCYGYIDQDGKFTIKKVSAPGSYDIEITDDDLNGISQDHRYGDINFVRVVGAKTEFNIRDKNGGASWGADQYYSVRNDSYDSDEELQSPSQQYLHQIQKRLTIQTYFQENPLYSLTAEDFAQRIADIVGERRSLLKVFVKVGAHGLDIGSVVRITRKKQPGFAYDGVTENSRDYVVVEISKKIDGVDLVLSDQKGIQDNSGDW